MRQTLILFLFASLLLSSPAWAQSPDQDDTEALASIVVHLLVTTSNGSQEGSGVIVSPEGIIFTAAHVVKDESEIRVELFDEFDAPPVFAYYARIRYISTLDNFDFAVLEIFADDQGNVDSNSLNLPYIQSWSRAAVVREPIEIFGYPESANGVLYVTNGIIGATPKQPIPVQGSTQDRFTFYLTNAIVGMGDSGGLVINSENEFVGIPIDWEDDEGGYVATILPISTICEVYAEACGYEPVGLPNVSPPISTESEYYRIPLPNSHFWSENLGLVAGTRELGGIPFEVGQFINTLGCPPVEVTNIISISTDIANPVVVHFLLQAGNAYQQYEGLVIGRIVLGFSSGSNFSIQLILGDNIRDWSRNFNGAVDTVTSSMTWEAWRGSTSDGREGGMDVISLKVPDELRGDTLVSIQVLDDTNITTGADPCIHLQAITVETE